MEIFAKKPPLLTNVLVSCLMLLLHKCFLPALGIKPMYFFFHSKDIQFGIKFKPKPHSGWKDHVEVDEIWVEELEPISECESAITG